MTALSVAVDLLGLIGSDTTLRRVAGTEGGEWHGPCPFCGGVDRFLVQPNRGRPRWRCRQCSPTEHWSDAIEYVQRRDHLSYPEAVARLTGVEQALNLIPRRAPMQPQPAADPEPPPAWRCQAEEIAAVCEDALWSDAGRSARRYLAERGIREETAAAWRLGYNGQDRRIADLWVEAGIVLPWEVDGEVWHLKIRRRTAVHGERYTAVAGGHPGLYGADRVRGREVALVCEGEFDALLCWQEAADLVGVCTLGAARPALPAAGVRALMAARTIFVAYDADDAGRVAAEKLAASSRRMRVITVPQGKDPTELHVAGGSVRDWLAFHLARLAARDPEPAASTGAPVSALPERTAAHHGAPPVTTAHQPAPLLAPTGWPGTTVLVEPSDPSCLHFGRVLTEVRPDRSMGWRCRDCGGRFQSANPDAWDRTFPDAATMRRAASELRAKRREEEGENGVARIISFAWTSPSLLAGRKTVTRRDWSEDYGRRFRKGDLVHAYDRSPRQGGRLIARLRLTEDARYEPDTQAPDADYEGEGFGFFAEHPELLPKSGRDAYRVTVQREEFDRWRQAGGSSWVVRFQLEEIIAAEAADAR